MPHRDIAQAMQRAINVFQRRPEAATHADATATARWTGGTRIVARHANGKQVLTDMPSELGGSDDEVTPGWLFRAGLASCAATSISMTAAKQGIALTSLEVDANSQSDARGLLCMTDTSGKPVYSGPFDVRLNVRISAQGVDAERLRALVHAGMRSSPIPSAVSNATPVALQIDVITA